MFLKDKLYLEFLLIDAIENLLRIFPSPEL
jgi:hypothetical protein